MRNLSYAILAFALILSTNRAHAQTAGTITFTASPASGTGSVVPKLTWSTTPVASSCTASGGWSGTKFASGTETLTAITATKTYSLSCTWGNGTATINWTKPTANTDGSPLNNLASYKVLYGTSASALNQVKLVSSPSATSTSIGSLQTGTWYFAMRAVNSAGAESDNSNVVQKTITAASAAKSLSITVTSAGTYKTTATPVYDVVYQGGLSVLGVRVGTVPLGTTCNGKYPVNTNYFPVALTKVTITTTPRSGTVVARCAKS
jgi:hypothetical protein